MEVLFVAPRSPAPRREGSAPPRPGMGNPPHVPWAQACGRILKPRMQASRNRAWWRGRAGRVCAAGDGRWAGESSRKPRRPRPYSRALAGIPLRVASRSWCHQSQRNVLKRDASHHVATNALPPYAHERPAATVCAYHVPRMPPTYGVPTVFTTMRYAALDREGSCKKGEHSLRSASPLPRAQ